MKLTLSYTGNNKISFNQIMESISSGLQASFELATDKKSYKSRPNVGISRDEGKFDNERKACFNRLFYECVQSNISLSDIQCTKTEHTANLLGGGFTQTLLKTTSVLQGNYSLFEAQKTLYQAFNTIARKLKDIKETSSTESQRVRETLFTKFGIEKVSTKAGKTDFNPQHEQYKIVCAIYEVFEKETIFINQMKQAREILIIAMTNAPPKDKTQIQSSIEQIDLLLKRSAEANIVSIIDNEPEIIDAFMIRFHQLLSSEKYTNYFKQLVSLSSFMETSDIFLATNPALSTYVTVFSHPTPENNILLLYDLDSFLRRPYKHLVNLKDLVGAVDKEYKKQNQNFTSFESLKGDLDLITMGYNQSLNDLALKKISEEYIQAVSSRPKDKEWLAVKEIMSLSLFTPAVKVFDDKVILFPRYLEIILANSYPEYFQIISGAFSLRSAIENGIIIREALYGTNKPVELPALNPEKFNLNAINRLIMTDSSNPIWLILKSTMPSLTNRQRLNTYIQIARTCKDQDIENIAKTAFSIASANDASMRLCYEAFFNKEPVLITDKKIKTELLAKYHALTQFETPLLEMKTSNPNEITFKEMDAPAINAILGIMLDNENPSEINADLLKILKTNKLEYFFVDELNNIGVAIKTSTLSQDICKQIRKTLLDSQNPQGLKFDKKGLDELYNNNPRPIWLVLKYTLPTLTPDERLRTYSQISEAYKRGEIVTDNMKERLDELEEVAFNALVQHPWAEDFTDLEALLESYDYKKPAHQDPEKITEYIKAEALKLITDYYTDNANNTEESNLSKNMLRLSELYMVDDPGSDTLTEIAQLIHKTTILLNPKNPAQPLTTEQIKVEDTFDFTDTHFTIENANKTLSIANAALGNQDKRTELISDTKYGIANKHLTTAQLQERISKNLLALSKLEAPTQPPLQIAMSSAIKTAQLLQEIAKKTPNQETLDLIISTISTINTALKTAEKNPEYQIAITQLKRSHDALEQLSKELSEQVEMGREDTKPQAAPALKYQAATANCGNDGIGATACREIAKQISAGNLDFFVLNCQENYLTKSIGQLETALQNLGYTITASDNMVTNTKPTEWDSLRGNCGINTIIIHKNSLSVKKVDTQPVKRGKLGTAANKGGMITKWNIEGITLTTASAHYDSSKIPERTLDAYNIRHAISSPTVTNFDDLNAALQNITVTGYDANTRNRLQDGVVPIWNPSAFSQEIKGLQQAPLGGLVYSKNNTYKTQSPEAIEAKEDKRPGYTKGGSLDFVTVLSDSMTKSNPNIIMENVSSVVPVEGESKRDHVVVISPVNTYQNNGTPFNRIKNLIATQLDAAAPALAEKIRSLEDNEPNQKMLVETYNQYLSKDGLLNQRVLIQSKLLGLSKLKLNIEQTALVKQIQSQLLKDGEWFPGDGGNAQELIDYQIKCIDILNRLYDCKNKKQLLTSCLEELDALTKTVGISPPVETQKLPDGATDSNLKKQYEATDELTEVNSSIKSSTDDDDDDYDGAIEPWGSDDISSRSETPTHSDNAIDEDTVTTTETNSDIDTSSSLKSPDELTKDKPSNQSPAYTGHIPSLDKKPELSDKATDNEQSALNIDLEEKSENTVESTEEPPPTYTGDNKTDDSVTLTSDTSDFDENYDSEDEDEQIHIEDNFVFEEKDLSKTHVESLLGTSKQRISTREEEKNSMLLLLNDADSLSAKIKFLASTGDITTYRIALENSGLKKDKFDLEYKGTIYNSLKLKENIESSNLKTNRAKIVKKLTIIDASTISNLTVAISSAIKAASILQKIASTLPKEEAPNLIAATKSVLKTSVNAANDQPEFSDALGKLNNTIADLEKLELQINTPAEIVSSSSAPEEQQQTSNVPSIIRRTALGQVLSKIVGEDTVPPSVAQKVDDPKNKKNVPLILAAQERIQSIPTNTNTNTMYDNSYRQSEENDDTSQTETQKTLDTVVFERNPNHIENLDQQITKIGGAKDVETKSNTATNESKATYTKDDGTKIIAALTKSIGSLSMFTSKSKKEKTEELVNIKNTISQMFENGASPTKQSVDEKLNEFAAKANQWRKYATTETKSFLAFKKAIIEIKSYDNDIPKSEEYCHKNPK